MILYCNDRFLHFRRKEYILKSIRKVIGPLMMNTSIDCGIAKQTIISNLLLGLLLLLVSFVELFAELDDIFLGLTQTGIQQNVQKPILIYQVKKVLNLHLSSFRIKLHGD